jgi:hypothetical protein
MSRPAAVAACIALAAAGPAFGAAPELNPDLLTVSGRHALPNAEGSPYKARLAVGEVVVAPGLERQTGIDPVAFKAGFTLALEKSLRNHGYLAAGAGDAGARALSLDFTAPELAAQPDGATAVVRLRAKLANADPQAPCAPFEARGEFHALAPLRSGAGQRVVVVAATVALAFVGVNGGAFMVSQFQSASAQNRALNAHRGLQAGEGVAPGGGEQAVARHAVVNATQLALAELIRHLGAPGDCRPAAAAGAPDVATGGERMRAGAAG